MKRILRKYGIRSLAIALTLLIIGTTNVDAKSSTWEEQKAYWDAMQEMLDSGHDWQEAAQILAGTNNNSDNTQEQEQTSEPTVPAHTHSWTESITTQPTCAANGVKTLICSCGEKKTETLAKVAHSYKQTDATFGNCVEVGTITYTCEVCGDSYKEDTKMGEHVFIASEDSKEATCNEAGLEKEVCQYCGEVKETTSLPLGCEKALKPTVTKEATCTEDGEQTYNCTRCGEVVEKESIPALGHTAEAKIVIAKDATFFTDGTEQHFCARCNEMLKENVLPATGGVYRIVLPVAVGLVVDAVIVVTVIMKKKKS